MLKFLAKYFVIFCTFAVVSIDAGMQNLVIHDISAVIKEALQPEHQLTGQDNKIQYILKMHENYSLFYETDLSTGLEAELENLVMILQEISSTAKLIISIKVPIQEQDENTWDKDTYINLLATINSHSSLITGLSFEMTNLEDVCKRGSETQQPKDSFLEKIKSLAKESNFSSPQTNLQIGYSLNLKYPKCVVHTENKKLADFLIVNVQLYRNDHIFVESYGAFKNNIDRIVNRAGSEVNKIPEDGPTRNIYFRPILTTNIQVNPEATIVDQNDGGIFQGTGKDQALVDTTIKQFKKGEGVYAKRYGSLLSQYCHEWVKATTAAAAAGHNRYVILDYYYKNTATHLDSDGNDFNDSYSNAMPIPLVSSIHVASLQNGSGNQKLRLNQAVSLLFEDVAVSGFDTVMILGDMWQEMAQEQAKYFTTCPTKAACRPANVLYFNNEDDAFSTNNKAEIQQLSELGGMHVTTLVFSTYFTESQTNSWAEVTKSFNEGQNISDSNSMNYIETACVEFGRYDVFEAINKHQDCDNTCVALALEKLSGCGSIGTTSPTILWRGKITLETYDVQDFVEKTMERLDAFVIARTMLNIPPKRTKVILALKIDHDNDNNGHEANSLYCSHLAERVARIYEMILTWGRIFDFPIIIYPHAKILKHINPLAWQKLHTSVAGEMQETMKSAPLFVRRNYLQSKISNPWAENMYPCLIQSKGHDTLTDLNQNKFVGVTLNMDLRLEDNPQINSNELQTILLIALGKFSALEITISQPANLQVLAQVISHPSFEANLKENYIEIKIIYLNLKISAEQVDREKENINSLVSNLRRIQFQVRIHSPFSDDDNNNVANLLEKDEGISFGYTLENCPSFAHQLVFTRDQAPLNMTNMDYLVCEADSIIPANNQHRRAMQDHLDSHLYLKKLFHHLYPNLKQVHFQLQPKLVGGNPQEQNLNLLKFLADLTNFAKGYGVHYFPTTVLPRQSINAQDDQASSFWIVNDYSDLADPSVYHERPVQYIKQNILKIANIDNEMVVTSDDDNIFGLSSQFFYILVAVVSMVIVLPMIFLLKMWISYRYLSVKEVNNFRKGKKEALDKAVIANKENKSKTGNLFNALVYQKDFELSKSELIFDKRNILSNGKFSICYRANTQKCKRDVIVEIVESRCPKDMFKALLSEVKMLCYVGKNGHIVEFVGSFTNEIRKGALCIVKEYCSGGTLLDHLQKCEEESNLERRAQDLIRFAKEIACGMKYLSSLNVVHGDLRVKNVYLDQNKACKIGHYGLDRNLLGYEKLVKEGKGDMLPWRWMAVESIRNMEFSSKSDVWSFGVTVWEIFSLGELPFWDVATWSQLFIDGLVNGRRLACPTQAPRVIYDAMQKCWEMEPDNRPEFPHLAQLFTEMLPTTRLTYVYEN